MRVNYRISNSRIVLATNERDRVAADFVIEVVECAADPRVAPGGIATRHLHNQLINLGGCSGVIRSSGGTAVVLFGEERSESIPIQV